MLPEQTSVLTLRVLPNDLDPSLHMNNGRYLAIMDLGRIDLLIRSGIGPRGVAQQVGRPSPTPPSSASAASCACSTATGWRRARSSWSENAVIIEQTFVFSGGERDGQIAARAIVKGAIYDRTARRYVPVTELMATIDVFETSPTPTVEVEAFLAADRSMREAGRSLRPRRRGIILSLADAIWRLRAASQVGRHQTHDIFPVVPNVDLCGTFRLE